MRHVFGPCGLSFTGNTAEVSFPQRTIRVLSHVPFPSPWSAKQDSPFGNSTALQMHVDYKATSGMLEMDYLTERMNIWVCLKTYIYTKKKKKKSRVLGGIFRWTR